MATKMLSPSSSCCCNKTKTKRRGRQQVVPFCDAKKKKKRRQQVVAFFTVLHKKIKLKEGKKAYLEAWKWKLALWRSTSALVLRLWLQQWRSKVGRGRQVGGRRGKVGGRRGEVGKRQVRGRRQVGRRKMFWGRIEAGKIIYIWARRMWFWFIPKTTSTASSSAGALVAAGSLQPTTSTFVS